MKGLSDRSKVLSKGRLYLSEREDRFILGMIAFPISHPLAGKDLFAFLLYRAVMRPEGLIGQKLVKKCVTLWIFAT